MGPTQALVFAGSTSNYATRPTSDGGIFNIPDGTARTVRVLFNLSGSLASPIEELVNNRDTSNNGNGWTMIVEANGAIGVGDGNVASALSSGGVIAPGIWVDAVAVFDYTNTANRKITMYANATSVAAVTAQPSPTASASPIIFGMQNVGGLQFPMTGALREVAIWTRALSAGEVTALYNGGAFLPAATDSTGLLAYWPLSGDMRDYSPGAGTGAYPLSTVGGLTFETISYGTPNPGFQADATTFFLCPMQEVSASAGLTDTVGGRNLSSLTNGPIAVIPSPVGLGRKLSGMQAFTNPSVADAGLLAVVQASHTLEMFIKPTSSGNAYQDTWTLSGTNAAGDNKGNDSTLNTQFNFHVESDGVFGVWWNFVTGGNVESVSFDTDPLGWAYDQWRVLAVVRDLQPDGTWVITYYVNGLQFGNAFTTGDQATSGGSAAQMLLGGLLGITGGVGTDYSNAAVAGLRISNVARTQAELLVSASNCLGGGGGAAVTFSAAWVAPNVVVTFSAAVLDSTALVNPGNYSITPPGGLPAVQVVGVTPVSAIQVALTISGDVRLGGSYSVSLLAGTACASPAGGDNAAGSASFTIAAVAFQVATTTPLPPFPSTQLQVQFTAPATLVSSGGTHDALNPGNYTITWAGGSIAVSSVSRAGNATDTVVLTTASMPPAGNPYELVPNSNLQSAGGLPIS